MVLDSRGAAPFTIVPGSLCTSGPAMLRFITSATVLVGLMVQVIKFIVLLRFSQYVLKLSTCRCDFRLVGLRGGLFVSVSLPAVPRRIWMWRVSPCSMKVAVQTLSERQKAKSVTVCANQFSHSGPTDINLYPLPGPISQKPI